MDGGEVVEGGDHLVGDAGQEPRRLDPAGAVLQPLLGDHAAAEQGLLEDVERAAALLGLVAQRVERGGRQPRAQGVAVHDVLEPGGAKAGRHGS